MSEPKYLIIRVDEGCPLSDINIGNINACKASKGCRSCLFGDTKQQLINKIAQVLIREVLADIKIKVDKRTLEELTKMQRQSAEKIIDFLGVK